MELVIYMALCAGYAGGSLPFSAVLDKEIKVFGRTINSTWVPEFLLAIPFGVFAAIHINVWAGPFAALWSYLWMQSATAPALHWGNGRYNPERTSTLKPFVDWLNGKTFKADPSTVQYCRLYMAVKGFLIGLPTGGLITAILWPAAYELGARFKLNHGIVECLTGTAAAISILVVC